MKRSASDSLRDLVLTALLDNGYSVLQQPLQLGDISLFMDLVCVGPLDRLDLVVIVNRPDTREEGLRLYWQVQRLARALDSVGSRRTITVVVIGGFDDPRLFTDLQTVARVLVVDDSLPVRRLLAPLLALEPPEPTQATLDAVAQVRTAVKGSYEAALLGLVQAASGGQEAVNAKYDTWIEDAFPPRRRRPHA